MQLGIGKTVFPSWAASLALVKAHGTAAKDHAAEAIRAETGAKRLDSAVRAMTSFDHAVDNSRKLPGQWFVPNRYYVGYEAARQAVDLLVASGLIPGARERVGVQSLIAAKETFHAGVDAAAAGSRYARHLASGWLDATAEDTMAGVRLLRPNSVLTRSLLAGVAHVRTAVDRKRPIDPLVVRTVSELFDQAVKTLASDAARAGAAGRLAAGDPSAFERSGELLEIARQSAAAMVAAAPDEAQLDALATAG